jgi:hypothetical protein
MTSPRRIGLPESYSNLLAKLAEELYPQWSEPKKRAKAILELSDFFINSPEGKTPWNTAATQVAYLLYFTTLNFVRAEAVVREAQKQSFLAGLDHVLEFGSGLGSASTALALNSEISRYSFIERSTEAQSLHKKILDRLSPNLTTSWSKEIPNQIGSSTLALFSYSLTELSVLPEWAFSAEALMIIEPSTQTDGRKLLQLRSELIKRGYSIWAPCPHQGSCPLLAESKTDWCHDRIFFEPPEWFKAIEKDLPIKNTTLTMSYLLARKTQPPKVPWARLVGDQLREKGKDRQLICSESKRQYFAWLHKEGPVPQFYRGDRVLIGSDVQIKGNELRGSLSAFDDN